MSKTGQWVYSMQEDAEAMTRNEFIKRHGINQVDIWDTAARRRKLEDELLPKEFAIIKELKNG